MTYTFQTLYIEFSWSDALNIDALRYIRLELSEQKYGDWIHTEINNTEIDIQPNSWKGIAIAISLFTNGFNAKYQIHES